MTRELTPREAKEIFVASDGDVRDYEDDPLPGPPYPRDHPLYDREDERVRQWVAQQDRLAATPEYQARITRDRTEEAASERRARMTDGWAAHRAFSHLGISPVNCSINWWGDPVAGGWIDVHIPGRLPVRVNADGTCSGGESSQTGVRR